MSARQWAQSDADQHKNWSESVKTHSDAPAGLIAKVATLNHVLSNSSSEDVLKDDRTTTVARMQVGSRDLVLKRYNARNQWHKISRAMRISRAHRCWRMSFVFQRVGLNVAQPVLMLEQRFGPIRKDAFYVSELLAGEELLSALPNMSQEEKQRVKKTIFDAFDVLNASRISHGDMKATNLLWVDGELFFIDLDAAKQHGFWSLNWRKSHLKDKRRFLKNWESKPDLLELFAGL